MTKMLAILLTLGSVAIACGDERSSPTASAPTQSPAASREDTDPTPKAEVPPSEGSPASDTAALFPDVLDVEARADPDGSWTFDVTLHSPYDSAERYADAWRLLAPDGTELGLRVLTHDHAGEQPFTRSLSGVEIPAHIDSVTVEGRDQQSGWGGATFEVDLIAAR